jgi:NAD(P) transhydrogenase subunit alpha
MRTIGILKEQNGDSRVCVIPQIVKKIINELQYNVIVELHAGLQAGFNNNNYQEAGAQIGNVNEVIEKSDILLSIHPFVLPPQVEAPKTCIAILNPLFNTEGLQVFLKPNLTVYSLDLVPRTSKAQSMDVLSSMASLAGYKAVLVAANLAKGVVPMFTTAAGTVKPAKILVIGAGVAGLQAIATAKRLGAIVDAFDVRKSAGEEVRSLGANFIEVEGAAENLQAGGYAIEQSEDFILRQKALIDKYVSEASIVITTANIPGKKAPVLIEKSSVEKMKFGSVIVDLAAEQGGNCEVTIDNQTINHAGVTIVGDSYLVRDLPQTASQLLSTNYFNFLKHWKSISRDGIINDTIVQDCLVIEDGKMVNQRVKGFIK